MKKFAIIAGLSLACALAGSANAQLITHKDLSLQTAVTDRANRGRDLQGPRLFGFGQCLGTQRRDHRCDARRRHRSAHAGKLVQESVDRSGDTCSVGKFRQHAEAELDSGARSLSNMVPAQGALPIMVGEDAIGAIGVSGAPGGDKDEACAKAGIDKVAGDLR
jgi:hypothetical protein